MALRSMASHITTHDPKRKFACPLCPDYTGATKKALDRHVLEQHPEIRPGNAPYSLCGRSIRPCHRKKHDLTHPVEGQPFVCLACGGSYRGSTSGQFYHHFRLQHPTAWTSNRGRSMPHVPSLDRCTSIVKARLLGLVLA